MVEAETEANIVTEVTEKKIQTENATTTSVHMQTERLESKTVHIQTFTAETVENSCQTSYDYLGTLDLTINSFELQILKGVEDKNEVSPNKLISPPPKRNSKFMPKLGLEISTGDNFGESNDVSKFAPATVKATKSNKFEINTDIEHLNT